MTLEEKLRELGDGFVYVGAHEGYFYIGPADEAFGLMPKINEVYQARTRKLYRSAVNTLKFLESGDALREFTKRMEDLKRLRVIYSNMGKAVNGVEVQRDNLVCLVSDDLNLRKATVSGIKSVVKAADDLQTQLRFITRDFDEEIEYTGKCIGGIPEKIRQTQKRMASLEKSLAKTDLMTRPVSDSYQTFEVNKDGKVTSPAGTVVLIEGTEGGDYWDYEEWLHPETIDHEVKCKVHITGGK